MPARPVPRRHSRSYGNDPLPTGAEALDEPLRAFPSWFLRIVCDRCGKERMIAETHMAPGIPAGSRSGASQTVFGPRGPHEELCHFSRISRRRQLGHLLNSTPN
jgi:hypothetical protein